ncbi:MAG: hypothetical protein ACKO7D_01775 [Bacteroidota bacterium]
MKSLYLSFFVFVSLSFSVNSQINVKSKSELKSQTHDKKEGGKYYSEYVVRPEKLKTFFHTGEIPADFPKYDKYKTFDENKTIAKAWAKENKSLIKQEFWFKFED